TSSTRLSSAARVENTTPSPPTAARWATTLAGTSASTTTHASPGVRARSPATEALIPQAPASANPRAGASAPSIVPRTVCGGARGTACLLHNPPHVRQQLLRIVHDAILD